MVIIDFRLNIQYKRSLLRNIYYCGMQSQCVVKQRKWDRFLFFRIVPYVFNALQYMNNLNVIAREISIVSRSNFMGQEVDVYGTAEEPLFLAKDVAKWIGHSDVSMMMRNVDEDEKVTSNVCTPGGRQNAWFLTEDGLYEVLMQSRKPIAKQFKKGVKDILKTIRRTGEFNAHHNQSASQPTLSDKIQAANFLADFLNLNGASKLAIAKSIADPLGLPTPDYVMDEKTVHAAKDLLATHKVKMSSAEFNKILVSKGIVERMTRPGKGGKTHSWVVIPEKYGKFGQNARNPHAQNQTQALWYDNKFSELLSLAGIHEGNEENHD